MMASACTFYLLSIVVNCCQSWRLLPRSFEKPSCNWQDFKFSGSLGQKAWSGFERRWLRTVINDGRQKQTSRAALVSCLRNRIPLLFRKLMRKALHSEVWKQNFSRGRSCREGKIDQKDSQLHRGLPVPICTTNDPAE